MKRMFHLELKNCLHRKEFKIIFLILMIISIGSFLFSCFYKGGGNQYGGSLLQVRSAFEMSMIQGPGVRIILSSIVLLIPLFSVIIFSDSYYSDCQSGVYKSILTRANQNVYVWAKSLVILTVTFLSFLIPFLINQLLCLIAFPIKGFDNNHALPPYDIGIQNFSSEWMFDLIRLQSPLLYNLIFMILISFTASLLALFAYSAYFLVKKGRFAVISGIFLLYIISQLVVILVGSYKFALVNLLIPGTGSFYVLLVWMSVLFISSLIIITMKSKLDVGIED